MKTPKNAPRIIYLAVTEKHDETDSGKDFLDYDHEFTYWTAAKPDIGAKYILCSEHKKMLKEAEKASKPKMYMPKRLKNKL